MKILIYITTLLLAPTLLLAQKKFSKEELKQDFAIMRSALEEAHPGLYRYHSKDEINAAFAKTEKQLNKPMTELEFYRTVNPMVAYIADGHTKFHRNKRPDDHFAFFENGYFPLKLHFKEDKAYILESYSNNNFPYLGCEIKTINGRAINAIKLQVFKNIFSDADITTFKYHEISQNFSGYFAELYGAFENFKIRILDKAGKTKELNLPAVPATSIPKYFPLEPVYTLTYPKPTVALMRIPAFQEKQGGQKFVEFLTKSFEELNTKGINSFIIDLRDNEGGIDAFGIKLYSFLTNKPFWYYDRFTVAGIGEFSFAKYAWLPPELAYLKQFVVKQGNEYLFTKKEGLGLQAPAKVPYLGKLLLLVNGRSYSVTTEFAAIVSDNNRGKIIGEETGGSYQGNTSGAFAMVTLPNTKLGFDIPLLGYYMKVKNKSNAIKGVPVDIKISPSIQDLLSKKDIVLQLALNLETTKP